MLNKIPRIPTSVIENLVKRFKELKGIVEASNEQLDKVEGIGEVRARAIKNGLRRLREQIMINKQL
jgi:diadenylate cyclase